MYNVKIIDYGDELQINHYENGVNTSIKHYMTDDEKADFERKSKLSYYDKYFRSESYALSNAELQDNEFHEFNIEGAKIDYVETCTSYSKQRARASASDVADMSESNKARSVRRTCQSIYELTRMNDWNYFATFTFADTWRYDYEICKKKLSQWFNNLKKRYCDIEYLAVPERHKDGAYHFHALIQGDLSKYLVDGYRKGRYILPLYKFGKNEFEIVRDRYKVANYITKYITKELLVSVNHKRRYIYSKGLLKPKIYEYQISDDYTLCDFILGNFPEYSMTHQKIYEHGGGKIQYIQLKKDEQPTENEQIYDKQEKRC